MNNMEIYDSDFKRVLFLFEKFIYFFNLFSQFIKLK